MTPTPPQKDSKLPEPVSYQREIDIRKRCQNTLDKANQLLAESGKGESVKSGADSCESPPPPDAE